MRDFLIPFVLKLLEVLIFNQILLIDFPHLEWALIQLEIIIKHHTLISYRKSLMWIPRNRINERLLTLCGFLYTKDVYDILRDGLFTLFINIILLIVIENDLVLHLKTMRRRMSGWIWEPFEGESFATLCWRIWAENLRCPIFLIIFEGYWILKAKVTLLIIEIALKSSSGISSTL